MSINIRVNVYKSSMSSFGPIDTIMEKLTLLKAGAAVRKLYKEGLVDAHGVPTKLGRTLARRRMAEDWYANEANVKKLADELLEYVKLAKAENEDED